MYTSCGVRSSVFVYISYDKHVDRHRNRFLAFYRLTHPGKLLFLDFILLDIGMLEYT